MSPFVLICSVYHHHDTKPHFHSVLALNCQVSSFRQMSLSHSLFVSLSPLSLLVYCSPLSLSLARSLWLIVQHFPPHALHSLFNIIVLMRKRYRRLCPVVTEQCLCEACVLSPTQPDYYLVPTMCSRFGVCRFACKRVRHLTNARFCHAFPRAKRSRTKKGKASMFTGPSPLCTERVLCAVANKKWMRYQNAHEYTKHQHACQWQK